MLVNQCIFFSSCALRECLFLKCPMILGWKCWNQVDLWWLNLKAKMGLIRWAERQKSYLSKLLPPLPSLPPLSSRGWRQDPLTLRMPTPAPDAVEKLCGWSPQRPAPASPHPPRTLDLVFTLHQSLSLVLVWPHACFLRWLKTPDSLDSDLSALRQSI